MAGAYRMALSRAEVTVTPAGGEPITHKAVTASVRDGMAVVKQGGRVIDQMPVATLERASSRDWMIVGPDATTWHVTKRCNCSGGR